MPAANRTGAQRVKPYAFKANGEHLVNMRVSDGRTLIFVLVLMLLFLLQVERATFVLDSTPGERVRLPVPARECTILCQVNA